MKHHFYTLCLIFAVWSFPVSAQNKPKLPSKPPSAPSAKPKTSAQPVRSAAQSAKPAAPKNTKPQSNLVTALPDSVVTNFPIGKPFLFLLPKGPKGSAGFTRYEVLEAPALSWLVDRSFYWDTDAEIAGRIQYLKFRAFNRKNQSADIVVAVQFAAK